MANRHGILNGKGSVTVPFAMKSQERRKRLMEEDKVEQDSANQTLTDMFLEVQKASPDVIGPRELLSLGLSVVAAGSETT